MSRYARQMILPAIGERGQTRLAEAHVLVVGAGGLGCPALSYLAGAGVGEITLIDPDHVEESNLHRQPLYRMSDLGRPKVTAANEHLLAANPDLRLNPNNCALEPANAGSFVDRADLVIDAADSFAVSYILSDVCQRNGTPLISASALGLKGYVGGFCGGAPSLRAVFPDLPGSGVTCATAGVMGPVVGMIGALQAQMAMQVLLGQELCPLGQLVSVDAKTLKFGGFSFLGAPEPKQAFGFVSAQHLTDQDQVIELRNEAEAPKLPSKNALRLLPDTLETFTPAPECRVVLCCTTGLRSWRAAKALDQRGHTNIALLAAGSSR